MSNPIKAVTLVGANGTVGAVALEKLASSPFSLQVLRRLGSKSNLPAGIRVVDVDFNSLDDLTAVLRGQDAVVSTLPADAGQLQRTIIDAAVAAGVRRFIPSEFGSNTDNARTRQIPVFAEKGKTQDYLKEKAQSGGISYTFVYSGPFLEWGLEQQFLLNTADYKPRLINDGRHVFSSTKLDTVGRSIVSILQHLDETKNRAVYLEDIKISQARILELAQQAAPEKPWEVSYAKLDDLVKRAEKQLEQGIINMESLSPFLYTTFMAEGYGGNFGKTDNELLGLGVSSEDFIVQLYQRQLQK